MTLYFYKRSKYTDNIERIAYLVLKLKHVKLMMVLMLLKLCKVTLCPIYRQKLDCMYILFKPSLSAWMDTRSQQEHTATLLIL